jgi:hypothetical protein
MRPGVFIDYNANSSATLTVPFWKENIPANLSDNPSCWFKLVFNTIASSTHAGAAGDGCKLQVYARALNVLTNGTDKRSINTAWTKKKSVSAQPRKYNKGDATYYFSARNVTGKPTEYIYTDEARNSTTVMTESEAINAGWLNNDLTNIGTELEGIHVWNHSLQEESEDPEVEAMSEGLDPGATVDAAMEGLSSVTTALETAALMTMSKPMNKANTMPVDHRIGLNDSCIDGTWRGAVLSRNFNPDTHTSPPCDAEDTNIATLCNKQFPIGYFDVAKGQTPGSLLASFPIDPGLSIKKTVDGHTLRFAPPAFYFANLSGAWRGDFTIHFRVFKTKFHTYKLRVVTNVISGTGGDVYKRHEHMEYLDVSETTEFSTKVPYKFVTPFATQAAIARVSIHLDAFPNFSNDKVSSDSRVWVFGSWDNIEFADFGPARYVPLINTHPAEDAKEDPDSMIPASIQRALQTLRDPFMMSNHAAIATTIGVSLLSKTPDMVYASIKNQLQVTPTVDKLMSAIAELRYYSKHNTLTDYETEVKAQLEAIYEDMQVYMTSLQYDSIQDIKNIDPLSLIYTPMQIVVNHSAPGAKNEVGEVIDDVRDLCKIYSPFYTGHINSDEDKKKWYYEWGTRDIMAANPHPLITGNLLSRCRAIASFYRLMRGGTRYKITTDLLDDHTTANVWRITMKKPQIPFDAESEEMPQWQTKTIKNVYHDHAKFKPSLERYFSAQGYPHYRHTGHRFEFCVPHTTVLPWIPFATEVDFNAMHPHVLNEESTLVASVFNPKATNDDFFTVEEAYSDDVAFCEFDGPPPYVSSTEFLTWSEVDGAKLSHEIKLTDFELSKQAIV